MRMRVGNQSILTDSIPGFFLACVYLFIHYNTQKDWWPHDFFMGSFHAGTNAVSRAERCPQPPTSLPLYTKSSWLKPAGLRLDWLKIWINHPYWLVFYPQENKISTLAAGCPDTERTRIGRWPTEISPGRLRCLGFPVPLSAEMAILVPLVRS